MKRLLGLAICLVFSVGCTATDLKGSGHLFIYETKHKEYPKHNNDIELRGTI